MKNFEKIVNILKKTKKRKRFIFELIRITNKVYLINKETHTHTKFINIK